MEMQKLGRVIIMLQYLNNYFMWKSMLERSYVRMQSIPQSATVALAQEAKLQRSYLSSMGGCINKLTFFVDDERAANPNDPTLNFGY